MRSFRVPHSAFHILGLATLVLLFYRQAAFTNLIFARGDTLLYFYPYWDFRAQALLAGKLPLWNPYLFMGVPFLANSQAGVFYPLNWPLISLSAPVAVKMSIVIHILIAAWGAYALARRAFELEPYPAFFAAAVFALGGYLSAQVEHVNQLQGLAWLPLALLATHYISSPSLPYSPTPLLPRTPAPLLLSLVVALQLTAGHTQTTFITLTACLVVALYNLVVSRLTFANGIRDTRYETRHTFWVFGIWAFGISLALGLAAIQLLPTLELSRLSLRGGGLPINEAVSFSLSPLLLGRALLPGYSRVIFSEFIAHIGLVPLALVIYSLITNYQLKKSPISNLQSLLTKPHALAILLSALGLFFALGGYNPIYLLLAKFVPGFNLFRVPARWLALYALGSALLAGHGLQQIMNYREASRWDELRIDRAQLIALTLTPIILISLTFFSDPLIPPGELGPLGLPTFLDLTLWLVPLGIFILSILVLRITNYASRTQKSLEFGILSLGLLELFIASLPLPLNHLTTPQAYSSIRPAMTQLLAHQSAFRIPHSAFQNPPARFLSLSALEFDPGDLAELHSEWDSQLPPGAVYDAIVATKHKEVLSPNLPLAWGVPSVDGFDGGILPLRAYAEFAKQFGNVPESTDGRLRQFLKTVPPNELLSLTNTRWIITDKTGDAWNDNVFYDLGLTAIVDSATPLTFDTLPDFQATALGLVLGDRSQTGVAQITLSTGETVTAPITYDPAQPYTRLRWDKPATVEQIVILTPTRLTLRGASLIDERTDTFHSLTIGPYRLAHSGDVKIYENLNILPRAFIISNLHSPITNYQSPITIKYEAEHVIIETDSDTPGYLILTDSNYPGWLATVDGQPAPIETAYGLFRAVALPAGVHTVEFRFDPPSLKLGAVISAISLVILVTLVAFSVRKITYADSS